MATRESTAPASSRIPVQASTADVVACIFNGLTCFVMAWLFWRAWWHPLGLDEGRWVRLGVGLMLLEFVLVHSGAALHHMFEQKPGIGRIKMVAGLLVLYTAFAAGFALAFKSWLLLGTYAAVMAGRLWPLFHGSWSEFEQAVSQRRMAASVVLYLVLAFATTFLPVPDGGLTPSLVSEVMQGTGEGAWIDHPEKPLAMGMLYFLLLGLIEIRPPRHLARVRKA